VKMQRDGGAASFGGVQHDADRIKSAENAGAIFLCAADVPLSFIGDLVMWPYTVAFTYVNRTSSEDEFMYPTTGALQPRTTPVSPSPAPLSMPKSVAPTK
jgi:hypothetical protein